MHAGTDNPFVVGKIYIKTNDEICWIHLKFFANKPGDEDFTTKVSFCKLSVL